MNGITEENLTFDKYIKLIEGYLAKRGGIDEKSSLISKNFNQVNPVKAEAVKQLEYQVKNMEIVENYETEVDKLKALLAHNGLEVRDKSVFTLLNSQLCWEILDFNVNSIYRSDLVYKLSSYSVEELSSYCPWELYERPKDVFNDLVANIEKMKKGERLISMDKMAPYIIVEAKTENLRKLIIQHKFVCGIYDQGQSEPKFFISAFTCKELEKDGSGNISVLR